jgi:hypothetical protein
MNAAGVSTSSEKAWQLSTSSLAAMESSDGARVLSTWVAEEGESNNGRGLTCTYRVWKPPNKLDGYAPDSSVYVDTWHTCKPPDNPQS